VLVHLRLTAGKKRPHHSGVGEVGITTTGRSATAVLVESGEFELSQGYVPIDPRCIGTRPVAAPVQQMLAGGNPLSRSLTSLDTVAFGIAVRRANSFTPMLVSWGPKAARSADIRRTTDVDES
jgi:hypothetical protein